MSSLTCTVYVYLRCERLGRLGETGDKTNVFAFYTSLSGFNSCLILLFLYNYSVSDGFELGGYEHNAISEAQIFQLTDELHLIQVCFPEYHSSSPTPVLREAVIRCCRVVFPPIVEFPPGKTTI